MLRTLDLTAVTGGYRSHLPRAEFDVSAAMEVVHPVCEAVRLRGTDALGEYSQRFDGVVPDQFRVPAEVLEAAARELDPELGAAFRESIARRRAAEIGPRRPAQPAFPAVPRRWGQPLVAELHRPARRRARRSSSP